MFDLNLTLLATFFERTGHDSEDAKTHQFPPTTYDISTIFFRAAQN